MNPIEMSKEVMAAISYTYELASYSTPELRSLFDDWLGEIEHMVIEVVHTQKKADPDQIGARLNLQPNSVIFILSKLTREGKIQPLRKRQYVQNSAVHKSGITSLVYADCNTL